MIVWDTENGKAEKVVICDICGQECTENYVQVGDTHICLDCATENENNL